MEIKPLLEWTIDQLRPIGGEIYDGMVPENVPLISEGYVKPYMAVWSQPLWEHDEQPLDYSSQETAGGLSITVVGHTAGTVRSWSAAVIRALHRVAAPGGGEYRYVPLNAPILYDEKATPGRYYQALTFSFSQP